MDLLRSLCGVSITCDKPSTDTYEASNLLRQDGTHKGFMAEGFIKPPVMLKVKFPCPVFLESVAIVNQLRSHSSTGLQILSYTLQPDQEVDKFPVFKPIGHCWEAKPGILIFTNRSYPRRSDIASYPPYGQKFYLSARDPGLLKSVRQIAIRIIRTGGGSVPVIGSLCIRGHVAHPERERFVKPVSSSVPIPPYTTPVTVVGESHPHTNPQKDSVQSLHLMKDTYTEPVEGISKDIPAEMLDPLTLTPMSLPIILPSGYTIDQSTLDRHVEAQKTWGRPPTDPFTGLLLQETNRPVFNTKLKERIDKHALINDINLPRTSGRKRDLGNEVVTNTKKLKQPDIPTVTRDCEDDSISNKLYQLLNRSSSHRTISLPRKETSIMCVGCNKSGLELTLYKLSCNHVICRSCLLAQNTRSIKCNDCNALSEKSSLVRQFRYT